MNLQAMGDLLESHRPLVPGMAAGAAATAWWTQQLVLEGAMRGLFSVLFGAGIILFMSKADRGLVTAGRTRVLMLRRLFWLLVFGVVNATLLLWPGDILQIYAVAGLLVLPLWRWPVRRLAAVAAVLLLVLSAMAAVGTAGEQGRLPVEGPRLEAQVAAGRALTKPQTEQLESWRQLRAGSPDDPKDVAEERTARMGGYGTNVAYMTRVTLRWWADWADTLWWVFDAAVLMVVGMALFRLGWLQGRAGGRTYLALALVGFGLGAPFNAWQAAIEWRQFSGPWSPEPWELIVPQASYQLPRLLVTLGWVGLFHLAWRAAPAVFGPLQALGRMAFTGYLLQSVLAAFIFSGFGLALWGRLDLAQLFGVAAAIWAVEIAFAVAWLSVFRMGPLEWVWRTLTYGRPPPFLRRREPAAAPAPV